MGLPTLVAFTAEWCAVCKKHKPILDALDHPVQYIDVDEQPEVAQRFGVMSLPTYLIFQDGQMTGNFGNRLKQAIEKL